MQNRLISINDTCAKLALSRTSLWQLAKRDDFPKPVNHYGNRKAFLEHELDEWIAARAGERDQVAA
jgi:prophage regulatory protein